MHNSTQMKYVHLGNARFRLFLRPPLKTEKGLFICISFLSILIVEHLFLGHNEVGFLLITLIIVSLIKQNYNHLLLMIALLSKKIKSGKIFLILRQH